MKQHIMTLSTFQQLDFTERLLAADHAICVAGRAVGKYMVLLYQLHSFYIEVYFSKEQKNIAALEGFDDLDKLDPYLEKIALPSAICK